MLYIEIQTRQNYVIPGFHIIGKVKVNATRYGMIKTTILFRPEFVDNNRI